jgi:hypothetical protein
MRIVHVQPPSFPEAPPNQPLDIEPNRVWQVLCGDAEHWRAGIYSPIATEASGCVEFERHTCPELFVLLSGRITLVLLQEDGERRLIELTPERPVLVTAPHAGFCPEGPHTGRAFVVERDVFSTAYTEN